MFFIAKTEKGVNEPDIRINKINIVSNNMFTKDKLVLIPFAFCPHVHQTHLMFGRQLTFGRHGIDWPVASLHMWCDSI